MKNWIIPVVIVGSLLVICAIISVIAWIDTILEKHYRKKLHDSLSQEYNEREQHVIAQERSLAKSQDEFDQKQKANKNQYDRWKKALESEIKQREIALTKQEEQLNKTLEDVTALLSDAISFSPRLAAMYSDMMLVEGLKQADELENKSHPAYTAAEKVRSITKDKRQWIERAKVAEYRLACIDSMFPDLVDYVPPISPKQQEDNNDAQIRAFLSDAEWQSLNENERNQLALQRYITSHNKTNWEMGRDYELSVAFGYMKKGYNVETTGSYLRLQDMGVDLIAEKTGHILLIQCKYWSEEKEIHEKHIFQLYGSAVYYQLQHPNKQINCLLITNTKFSDVAIQCAKIIGVTCVPNHPFVEFPRIKCNVSSSGEKIYHLPMDQQYDNVIIRNPGECYAYTVDEATAKGFRRANRWYGS